MRPSEVTLCKINTSTPAFSAIKGIYLSAFPECERREEGQWADLIDSEPLLSLYAVACGDSASTIGFITSWNFDGFIYIEHFAISETVRNGGFGTKAIRKFLDCIAGGKRVVLEVEPPGISPLAQRRISFYQRQGFVMSGYAYKQPPYAEGKEMIDLKLMSTNPIADEEDYASIVKTIHSKVYGYCAEGGVKPGS